MDLLKSIFVGYGIMTIMSNIFLILLMLQWNACSPTPEPEYIDEVEMENYA